MIEVITMAATNAARIRYFDMSVDQPVSKFFCISISPFCVSAPSLENIESILN
jgi:hypothetical protein